MSWISPELIEILLTILKAVVILLVVLSAPIVREKLSARWKSLSHAKAAKEAN